MTLTPIADLIIARSGRISRNIHDLIYDDISQSLCARAWYIVIIKNEPDPFWIIWMKVFGPSHCRRAFLFHVKRRKQNDNG